MKHFNEIDFDITPQWISNQMQELNIKRTQLMEHLTLDKSTISLLLSGERKMNKSVKAMFFYYFEFQKLKVKKHSSTH